MVRPETPCGIVSGSSCALTGCTGFAGSEFPDKSLRCPREETRRSLPRRFARGAGHSSPRRHPDTLRGRDALASASPPPACPPLVRLWRTGGSARGGKIGGVLRGALDSAKRLAQTVSAARSWPPAAAPRASGGGARVLKQSYPKRNHVPVNPKGFPLFPSQTEPTHQAIYLRLTLVLRTISHLSRSYGRREECGATHPSNWAPTQ